MIVQDLPLILKDTTKINMADIETLYAVFKNDFIDNKVVLKIANINYTVTVKPNNKCSCPFTKEPKPERFWHIITTKEFDSKKRNNPCPADREKNRIYESARAKRIHWIKQTIDNISNQHIKYFYENNGVATHFIWDTKRFYIVIIKHLGKTENLLVTAYPVHKNKYRSYKSRLERYEKSTKK